MVCLKTEMRALRLLSFDQRVPFRVLTKSATIVKRVSWFKSSLLLRINNKHTYKY
jgi:hypothetical protein